MVMYRLIGLSLPLDNPRRRSVTIRHIDIPRLAFNRISPVTKVYDNRARTIGTNCDNFAALSPAYVIAIVAREFDRVTDITADPLSANAVTRPNRARSGAGRSDSLGYTIDDLVPQVCGDIQRLIGG